MPKMVVNTDAYQWLTPNPAQGQPPVVRTAHRGEVIDVSDEEAERGRSLKVDVDYPVGAGFVRTQESALVEQGYDQSGAAANAAKEARAAQLRAELASLTGEPELTKPAKPSGR